MIGLPTETEEDILGIPNLISVIGDQYYSIPKEKKKRFTVTISTPALFPAAHALNGNRRTASKAEKNNGFAAGD